MHKLKDLPIVFVHYPAGAGGWFLASLLYNASDPVHAFMFDNLGSCYANKQIRTINNFYTEFAKSQKGMQIIQDTAYDTFTREERIAYLQDTLSSIKGAPPVQVPHVIAISCCNINVFMEAFPQAKCIQLNIDKDDLIVCTANFLRWGPKTREKFDQFCNSNNIAPTDALWEKYVTIADNPYEFAWATSHIESTAKTVPNNPDLDGRFFEIMYKEFMFDDVDNVLGSIVKFIRFTPNNLLYDEMCNNMLIYRGQQLRYKL
jgi:hypothetical protein